MNTYILAYHDEIDEVRLVSTEAESWQDALRNVGWSWIFSGNPAVLTFSQAQEEAKENGFYINLKLLIVDAGARPHLIGDL